jgi:hypothetical protein
MASQSQAIPNESAAFRDAGKGTPGRKAVFSWRLLIARITESSRAQRVVATPFAAHKEASAVPQAPPPITPRDVNGVEVCMICRVK